MPGRAAATRRKRQRPPLGGRKVVRTFPPRTLTRVRGRKRPPLTAPSSTAVSPFTAGETCPVAVKGWPAICWYSIARTRRATRRWTAHEACAALVTSVPSGAWRLARRLPGRRTGSFGGEAPVPPGAQGDQRRPGRPLQPLDQHRHRGARGDLPGDLGAVADLHRRGRPEGGDPQVPHRLRLPRGRRGRDRRGRQARSGERRATTEPHVPLRAESPCWVSDIGAAALATAPALRDPARVLQR